MTATRREFLMRGLGTSFVPFLAPGLRAAFPRAEGAGSRSLLLVELAGGNDGLNTVIPYRQDAYREARPTLALERSRVLDLDGEIALHPALEGLRELYEEGRLAVVQSVGYPGPDRSHFRSMDIWHTASLNPQQVRTGWVGRLADSQRAADPQCTPALALGGREVPRALVGERAVAPSIESGDALRLHLGADGAEASRRRESLRRLVAVEEGGAENPNLDFLRRAARTAYASADRLQRAIQDYRSPVDYPRSGLGGALRTAAQLIAGRLPTSVYHVRQTGYDTHALQADAHRLLLADLGAALLAFQRDLEHLGLSREVAIFVYSEFGRRVRENGSRGTDHGAAAPSFVLGRRVRGGVYGEVPDLHQLSAGDIPYRVDFRGLYATLLRDWLGVAPRAILGEDFERLPIFRRPL